MSLGFTADVSIIPAARLAVTSWQLMLVAPLDSIGPWSPAPSPGARYHSRKLEFSGILDKVHTGAPDLTLDKQCAAMITTLLPTSQTLSSTRKENCKLNKTQNFRLRWYDSDFNCSLSAFWVLSECLITLCLLPECSLTYVERWRLTALDKLDTNERTNERTNISISWAPIGAKTN